MKRNSFTSRVLATVIAVLIVIGVMPMMSVSAETTETGKYGDFEYSIANEAVTIIGYTGEAKDVIIPATIDGYPVECIGFKRLDDEGSVWGAFMECTTLESVTIPDTVKIIDAFAFYECTALSSVTIQGSVESIGSFAFSGCTSLKEVTFKEGLKTLWGSAFEATAIESVYIPASVTAIYGNPFDSCSNLTSIIVDANNTYYDSRENCNAIIETSSNTLVSGCRNTIIPYSVSTIGSAAFMGQPIQKIDIPASINRIQGEAFAECSELTEIGFPRFMEKIERNAFRDCISLERVDLPYSTNKFWGSMFVGCYNLTEITYAGYNTFYYSKNAVVDYKYKYQTSSNQTDMILLSGCKNTVIGKDIVEIGEEAFEDCKLLNNIDIPQSVTKIGYNAFAGCELLEELVIPAKVEHIGRGAFSSCKSLTEMVIPENVTVVEDELFKDCESLSVVTLPKTITNIDKDAFSGCSSLTDVYFMGTKNQWNRNVEIAEGNEALANATIHFMSSDIIDVKGNSITLSGSIGVNYYIELSEQILADEGATVVFTYNDNTVTVPVSEGVETENGYMYTCNIPAKDMTTKVLCKVVSSSGKSEEYEYSVMEYAEIILANPDVYGEDAVSIVKSMLNYGAAAQKYFGYNTESLANNTEYMTDEDRTVPAKDFSDLNYTLTEGAGDVKYYGTSLLLRSEVGIKHYFIVSEGTDIDALTVTVDGKNAELRKNGVYYELTVPNIAAHNLYTDYDVTVGDVSLSYCVMDYATTAQKAGNPNLIEIMSALDVYAQSAMAYEN